jgi:thiamine-monophosphate kinase
MRTESDIIKRVWSSLPTKAAGPTREWLKLGVGDDAAVLRHSPTVASDRTASDLVLSCDAFLENVHLLADAYAPDAIGYKALARATSDLAAMGAAPRFFMLSLALPANRTGKWLDGMINGMARAAREFGMVLIGGDTSQNSTVIMNITVGGDLASGSALTRSGAQPGDGIYVSGTLGAAQLGLELVLRGRHRDRRWKRLILPHLRPKIHVELGRWLADAPHGRAIASAATDTSDGLSTDLAHICEASGVRARIFAAKIPAVQIPRSMPRNQLDSLQLALHGGEDYQLLFTVPKARERGIPKLFRGTPITRIGEILGGKSDPRSPLVELVDVEGQKTLLIPLGWDSFRVSKRN